VTDTKNLVQRSEIAKNIANKEPYGQMNVLFSVNSKFGRLHLHAQVKAYSYQKESLSDSYLKIIEEKHIA